MATRSTRRRRIRRILKKEKERGRAAREAKPLSPLTPHAWGELARLQRGPEPGSKINPGVIDRLHREHLVRLVMMSSPFPTHKGRHIQHVLITDAGLAKLKERP